MPDVLMTESQKALVEKMNKYIQPSLSSDATKEMAKNWIDKNYSRFKFLVWQEKNNGK